MIQRLLSLAGPIILANLASPLLGLVDTAVIGQLGDVVLLGALALATMIFNFIFWGFGFLRMGTTALVAQAKGRKDNQAATDVLMRSLLLASLLGITLWLIQQPLHALVFSLTGASQAVEAATSTYYQIRIWGAPIHLMILAIMGYLLGQQRTRQVLLLQVILNGSNIIFDLVFVVFLNWSVAGVAAATLLAEVITLFLAFAIVFQPLLSHRAQLFNARLLDWPSLKTMLSIHRDIMIRTLCLIFAFAWFTDSGARLGDDFLAANLLLMQFVTFSAFFIDGFAMAGESLIGEAHGQANPTSIQTVIRAVFLSGAGIASLLTLGFFLFSAPILHLLTTNREIVEVALEHQIWMLLTPLISFPAYIYDGLFIGATKTREMRNAMLIALAVYLIAWFLTQSLLNHGLWLALMIYYVARASSLAYYHLTLYRFHSSHET